MELKDRIRARLKALRLSQSELASRVGVSRGTVTFWMNGTNLIKGENLMAVARELQCSPEWLISGAEAKPSASLTEAVMIGDLSPWDDSTPLDKDEVELPLYKEVELAAGSGRTAVQEMPGRKLRFSYATLRAAGVDPAAAVCAQLKGNSMEPLIMNGATVGIDKATTRVVDGEIYALEHDGMLRVKYLYRLPGGGLRLRSFNRAEHDDEEYSPKEMQSQGISIIGWVFWWSTLRSRGAFKR
ncbi:S24 family peptidase [Pseudomonas aeruginosa]|uniref:S24 family peptidase n=1 Tax=Pseudomonas aeruginosa TaxID=287 RepID=UPI001F3F8C0C|nr:helix-turn-helix transcriptional regulator [Pseudomonas aeruginosa]